MLVVETGAVIAAAAGTEPPSCRANTYLALVTCPALALTNPEPRVWLALLLFTDEGAGVSEG